MFISVVFVSRVCVCFTLIAFVFFPSNSITLLGSRSPSVHLHTAAAAHCIVSDQESKHPLEPFAHTTTTHRYHHTLARAQQTLLRKL